MIKKYNLLSGLLGGLLCSFNAQAPNAFGQYILDCMPSYRQYDLNLLAESDGKYCLFDDKHKYPKFDISLEEMKNIYYKRDIALLKKFFYRDDYEEKKISFIEQYKNESFFNIHDLEKTDDSEEVDDSKEMDDFEEIDYLSQKNYALDESIFKFFYNSGCFHHPLTFNHIFFKILGSIWNNEELEQLFIQVFKTQDGTSPEAQKLREIFLNTLSKKEYLFLITKNFTINHDLDWDYSFYGIENFYKLINIEKKFKKKIEATEKEMEEFKSAKQSMEENYEDIFDQDIYKKKINDIFQKRCEKIKKIIKADKKNKKFFRVFWHETGGNFLQEDDCQESYLLSKYGACLYPIVNSDENKVYFLDCNSFPDPENPLFEFLPIHNLKSDIMFKKVMNHFFRDYTYNKKSLPLYLWHENQKDIFFSSKFFTTHFQKHTIEKYNNEFFKFLNVMWDKNIIFKQHHQEERKRKFFEFEENFNKKFHLLLNYHDMECYNRYKKNSFLNFWLSCLTILFQLTPQENHYIHPYFFHAEPIDHYKIMHKIIKKFLLQEIENQRNKIKRQIHKITDLMILYDNFQYTIKKYHCSLSYPQISSNLSHINIWDYLLDDFFGIYKIAQYYKDIYCNDYEEIFKRCIFHDLCFGDPFVYKNMTYEVNKKKLSQISLTYKEDYFRNPSVIKNLEEIFAPLYTLLTSCIVKFMAYIPSVSTQKTCEEKYLNIYYFVSNLLHKDTHEITETPQEVRAQLEEMEKILKEKVLNINSMEENENLKKDEDSYSDSSSDYDDKKDFDLISYEDTKIRTAMNMENIMTVNALREQMKILDAQ